MRKKKKNNEPKREREKSKEKKNISRRPPREISYWKRIQNSFA